MCSKSHTQCYFNLNPENHLVFEVAAYINTFLLWSDERQNGTSEGQTFTKQLNQLLQQDKDKLEGAEMLHFCVSGCMCL